MNHLLQRQFDFELQQARMEMSNNDKNVVWNHLARAHILSQFFVGPHLKVHFRMFVFAWKTMNLKEICGQIPRIVLAGPGSFFKKAPRGNTGLSSVGMFQPMPIPKDLQKLLD